jgi:predicted Zn-dependent peptidase
VLFSTHPNIPLRVNLKTDPMVPDKSEDIIEKMAHQRILGLIREKKEERKRKMNLAQFIQSLN